MASAIMPVAAGVRRMCAAALILVCLSTPPRAVAEPPDGATVTLDGTRYARVREALLEAIAEEGLASPLVSNFGDMLRRTAGDLGHSDALYENAEIFIFCSIAVAARLATEARDNIAQCPMSIAIYSTPETPEKVVMTYRLPPGQSPGARMAAETVARIASRTYEHGFP